MDSWWNGFNSLNTAKMHKDLKQKLALKTADFRKLLRKKPVLIGIVAAGIFILWIIGGGSKDAVSHSLSTSTVPFDKKESQMTGIKESVDPRDVWTAKLEQRLDSANADWQKKLDKINEANDIESRKLQKELEELKALLLKQQEIMQRKELEDSLHQSNLPTQSNIVATKPKSLGSFSKEYGSKKKNTKDYITSGSFARAVLMTGVVVGTGSNTQSNPEPVMMRLTDSGIFSKGKRTDQIKEAILIGDCSGDLSSERAKCRLQTLSLENYKGEIVERSIQGWIVGEDGRNGIKGIVVDKSSDMLRMAMLNGVLGGMSTFLQNQPTKSIFPISPMSEKQNAMSGIDQLKGGVANGAGDAFSKMADFVMERFNSMSPQIVIASGRQVDVVFQHGVDLNGETSKEQLDNSGNMGVNYNSHAIPKQSRSFQNVIDKVHQDIEKAGEQNGF